MNPEGESTIDLFISYRRGDSQLRAATLHMELAAHYGVGRVFRDLERDGILSGERFSDRIFFAIKSSQVLLVLIGPNWLRREGGFLFLPGRARIHQPDDWVRREIATGWEMQRIVIPVLLDGAQMPSVKSLPTDLQFLPELHAVEVDFRDPALRARGLDRLLARLKTLCPPASVAGKDFGGLLHRAAGAPWEPGEPLNPHAYDYKFRITNESARRAIRSRIFHASVNSSAAFDPVLLSSLAEVGEYRKYLDSENKHGLFLQASCMLTAGGCAELPEQLLVVTRAGKHDHACDVARTLAGASCLVSTPLASFGFLDEHGHCPVILFNDPAASQPLALFSRKLLAPFSSATSRFAGIGFNFESEGKEYLFFVWHVHLPSPTDVLLTFDCQKEEDSQDEASWVAVQDVRRDSFAKAPVDQAVMQSLLARPEEARSERNEAKPWGFITDIPFERVRAHPTPVNVHLPHPYHQLGAAFQHLIHQGKIVAPASIDELAVAFGEFAVPWMRRFANGVTVTTSSAETAGLPSGKITRINADLPGGRQHGIFILMWSEEHSRPDYPSWSEGQFVPEPHSVILLRGLPSSQRYLLQGTLRPYLLQGTLRPVNSFPILEFRIACHPEGKLATLIVSHAVLLFSSSPWAPEEILVMQENEEAVQQRKLPGGTIQKGEAPLNTIYRKLEDELGLKRDLVGEVMELRVPAGTEGDQFTDISVNPQTGERTLYLFHPFLVCLTESGRCHLWQRVNLPGSCIRLTSLTLWRDTGFSYQSAYVRQLHVSILNSWKERLVAACSTDQSMPG